MFFTSNNYIQLECIVYHIYPEFLSLDAFPSVELFAAFSDVSDDPFAALSEVAWATSPDCEVCGAVEFDDGSEDAVGVDEPFGFSSRSMQMFALLSIDLAKFKRTSMPDKKNDISFN